MSGLGFLSADEIRSSMASRRTRVALAADLITISEISDALSQAGPSICMLKTHVDGVVDFEYNRWMDEVIRPARDCLLYTSPSPRDSMTSRMPSSA